MEESAPVEIDPDLEYPGWESYKEATQIQLNSYHAHIRVCFE